MKNKIFIIDIDGTICEDIKNEEGVERMRRAKPYSDNIAKVNEWHSQGHLIYFDTAREEEHREVTIEWLERNGVKYNGVRFHKPRKTKDHKEYHYIDNLHVRASTLVDGKITDFVKKKIEIEVFDR